MLSPTKHHVAGACLARVGHFAVHKGARSQQSNLSLSFSASPAPGEQPGCHSKISANDSSRFGRRALHFLRNPQVLLDLWREKHSWRLDEDLRGLLDISKFRSLRRPAKKKIKFVESLSRKSRINKAKGVAGPSRLCTRSARGASGGVVGGDHPQTSNQGRAKKIVSE